MKRMMMERHINDNKVKKWNIPSVWPPRTEMRTRATIGKVIFLGIAVNSFAGTAILRVNIMIHSSLSIIAHKMQTSQPCHAKIVKNTSFCIYILWRLRKNTVCVIDCFTKSGISHHPPTAISPPLLPFQQFCQKFPPIPQGGVILNVFPMSFFVNLLYFLNAIFLCNAVVSVSLASIFFEEKTIFNPRNLLPAAPAKDIENWNWNNL